VLPVVQHKIFTFLQCERSLVRLFYIRANENSPQKTTHLPNFQKGILLPLHPGKIFMKKNYTHTHWQIKEINSKIQFFYLKYLLCYFQCTKSIFLHLYFKEFCFRCIEYLLFMNLSIKHSHKIIDVLIKN
jgi:hypothetical protein